jgi:hypothetical protein
LLGAEAVGFASIFAALARLLRAVVVVAGGAKRGLVEVSGF